MVYGHSCIKESLWKPLMTQWPIAGMLHKGADQTVIECNFQFNEVKQDEKRTMDVI